jgi:ribosomal protein S18 acetylase RimI-like enzyme
MNVRRLQEDDHALLALLAASEEDFDVAGRSESRAPLAEEEARAFLKNALFWVAEKGGELWGFLSCQLIRKRAEAPELLLYEIGVREAHRRHGVGRALLAAMDEWMKANSIEQVWVLADNPGAVAFYRACGFSVEDATYMTR